MKRLASTLCLATALIVSACAPQPSTVAIDTHRLVQAATELGLTLSIIRVQITGPGMEAIRLEVDPAAPEFEVQVPSGRDRVFDVTAWQVTGDAETILYWGTTTTTLQAGARQEVLIPAVPAGLVRGTVATPDVAVPDGTLVTLKLTTPAPAGFPADYTAAVTQGAFERIAPVGIYDVTGSFERSGVTYRALPVTASFTQGEVIILQVFFAPDGYCDADRGLTPDLDGDGVPCHEDCNDALPHCAAVCTDIDGDGWCVDQDCDDAASTCSATCTDSDTDQVPDCRDRCVAGVDNSAQVSACQTGSGACELGSACSGAACVSTGSEVAGNAVDEDCDGFLTCYLDADGDGLGAGATTSVLIVSGVTTDCVADGPGDQYTTTVGDCDDAASTCITTCAIDTDTDSVPDCRDQCVSGSDNTSTLADGGLPVSSCVTGTGACNLGSPCTIVACNGTDQDGDGLSECFGDCNDNPTDPSAPQMHGFKQEVCNDGVDNNCDGFADGADEQCCADANTDGICDSFPSCEDQDGDGFYGYTEACESEAGGAGTYLLFDCDDTDSGKNHADLDNDFMTSCGYDDYQSPPAGGGLVCEAPSGPITYADCDDTDDTIFAEAAERCGNFIDDNCNGTNDDGCGSDLDCVDTDGDQFFVCATLCADVDADGVYDAGCPFSDHRYDCDNGDPAKNWLDADNDGYATCGKLPYGEPDSPDLPDCDDTIPYAAPDFPEHCGDGVDNDCDGLVDALDTASCDGVDNDGDRFEADDCDDDPVTGPTCFSCKTFFLDEDGDGYGTPASSVVACDPPPGPPFYSDRSDDCDDDPATGAAASPGLTETCDGVDNDCDGTADNVDRDSDGSTEMSCLCSGPACPPFADDCDDNNPQLDGADLDGDGWSTCNGDCDDNQSNASPSGGPEVCDGLDNDCDGTVDNVDDDFDGISDCFDMCPGVNAPAGPVPDSIELVLYRKNQVDGQGEAYDFFLNGSLVGQVASGGVLNDAGSCTPGPSGFEIFTFTDSTPGNATFDAQSSAAWQGNGTDNLYFTRAQSTAEALAFVRVVVHHGSFGQSTCLFHAPGLQGCPDNVDICGAGAPACTGAGCPPSASGDLPDARQADRDGDGAGDVCDCFLDTFSTCLDPGVTVRCENNPSQSPHLPERCGNSADDNCDGVIDENCVPVPNGDCDDLDVDGYVACASTCVDGDSDGVYDATCPFTGHRYDCDDSSFYSSPANPAENKGDIPAPCSGINCCDDAEDNDCDGLTDSADSDCRGQVCGNFIELGTVKPSGGDAKLQLDADFCNFEQNGDASAVCAASPTGQTVWTRFTVLDADTADLVRVCFEQGPGGNPVSVFRTSACTPTECFAAALDPTGTRCVDLPVSMTGSELVELGWQVAAPPTCPSPPVRLTVQALNTSVCSDRDQDSLPDCVDPCVDADGDGYGEGAFPTDGCSFPEPDCNDGASCVFPGATEICDGFDNDCDGFVDATDFERDGIVDSFVGTNLLSNETFNAPPIAGDFQIGANTPGWTIAGTSSDWGLYKRPVVGTAPFFPSQMAGTNGNASPTNEENGFLDSPSFIPGTGGRVLLTFDSYFNHAGGCTGEDVKVVEVVLDGTTPLPMSNCFEPWFQPQSRDRIERPVYDLTPQLEGAASAHIRFGLNTNGAFDNGGTDGGWYLDNVRVYECTVVIP